MVVKKCNDILDKQGKLQHHLHQQFIFFVASTHSQRNEIIFVYTDGGFTSIGMNEATVRGSLYSEVL
jgi:hypothetical protein